MNAHLNRFINTDDEYERDKAMFYIRKEREFLEGLDYGE
jgi:hypothetical protein